MVVSYAAHPALLRQTQVTDPGKEGKAGIDQGEREKKSLKGHIQGQLEKYIPLPKRGSLCGYGVNRLISPIRSNYLMHIIHLKKNIVKGMVLWANEG